MRLSPAKFNAHIRFIGQDVRWRPSYPCPCINPNSGASKPGCPRCGGKGRFWTDPVAGFRVGVPNQKTQREWAEHGVYEAGDIVVTLPSNVPAYTMGYGDRMTMLNAFDNFALVHTRGKQEKLRYEVESITRVFWNGTGDTLIDGGIPAVDADGNLTWTTDPPPLGTQYTIAGTKRPEYFCFRELPSNRAEHGGAPLPRKVVLRRFDLFGR